MSSPFAIFRRHQRVLMVVVTGFAMISFVLLGAVSDPQNMPTALVVLFLASLIGGVAWIAGLSSGKASEYGITGVLIGAVIGLAAVLYSRDVAAVQLKGGNLSSVELSNLRRQRFVANQFVQLAFHRTGSGPKGERQQFESMFFLPQYLFGFSQGEGASTQDVVLGEILRREAGKFGLTIADKVVTDYIKELTGEKITAEMFTEIRKQIQVSEEDLLAALKAELLARNAFQLLYGNNQLPPQTYWDFHRRIAVNATAELVRIPVADFADESAQPSDKDLQDLFDQYRGNVPGYTPQGRAEEGRPGFAQPRRIQLGYLEAVLDEIEPLVTPPTDDEIKAEYDRRYLRKVPDSSLLPPELELPPGLDLPLPQLPEPGSAPDKTEADSLEASQTPATPPSAEGTPEKGPSEPPSSDAPSKETPSNETPPGETPKEGTEPEPSKTPDNAMSRYLDLSETRFVAFQGDTAGDAAAPAETKPETSAAPAEPPKPAEQPEAADKPAVPPAGDAKPEPAPAATPDKPAEGDASAKPAAGDAPAESKDPQPTDGTPSQESDPPPAPKKDIPPLDDQLKEEIRRDLLRQRAQIEVRDRAAKAFDFLSELAYNVLLLPGDKGFLTKEEATRKIEDYAAKNNLIYVVTPMLSEAELQDSEDFPIGRAISMMGTPAFVSQAIFQTATTDLYRVGKADNFGTASSFAFWKLADKEAFIPESLSDGEYVRDQVTKIWRQRQAAPKALERAQSLAAKLRESGKPMAEALSEETVTGAAEALFLTVQETGEFSWMQRSSAAPTSMSQAPTVRRSIVNGAADAGDRFFQTVFQRLKKGEVDVVANEDDSAFFIVRIKETRPSTEEEETKLRNDFIAAGVPPTFSTMAQQSLREHAVNFVERMFEMYDVFIDPEYAG